MDQGAVCLVVVCRRRDPHSVNPMMWITPSTIYYRRQNRPVPRLLITISIRYAFNACDMLIVHFDNVSLTIYSVFIEEHSNIRHGD